MIFIIILSYLVPVVTVIITKFIPMQTTDLIFIHSMCAGCVSMRFYIDYSTYKRSKRTKNINKILYDFSVKMAAYHMMAIIIKARKETERKAIVRQGKIDIPLTDFKEIKDQEK